MKKSKLDILIEKLENLKTKEQMFQDNLHFEKIRANNKSKKLKLQLK